MIAYLDLPSGLSGDMLLGCLIDCGWPLQRLRHVIEQLDLPSAHWAVEVENVLKGPLQATQVRVLAEEGGPRRGLKDIQWLIETSEIPDQVKIRSMAVFSRLAAAEAKVHGTTPEQIHFHEVGALDAIIDIVGGVTGLHELAVEQLYASALPLGHGWAQTAHGRLPLPAPATMELLAAAGAPTRPAPGAGELLTPTAAAILAEAAVFQQPAMVLSRIGIGAGQKNFAWPNIARMWLGLPERAGTIVQLETNIDDMNPQVYAAVSDRLFAAGAVDVWMSPVQMKKGRPGIVISVLAYSADETVLADLLLRETSTLGVRVHPLHRHEARREMREVATAFGTVRVKIKWLGQQPVGASPEYDDCKALADAGNAPIRDVLDAAAAACHSLLASIRSEPRGV